MGSYADVDSVRAYAAAVGFTGLPDEDHDADLEALIAIAEEDVDGVVGPLLRDETTGRKYDPADLADHAATALARATAAAVIWRISIGDRIVVADDGSRNLAHGGFSLDLGPPGRPPGDAVREELAGHGLVVHSGVASADA